MNFKKLRNNKKKGFTLIEMVMVVVILGILSSMALVKYSKVQDDAKLKADYATASTLVTATTIAINDGKVSTGTITTTKLVSDGYLQGDVKCNKTGEPFNINIDNNGDITVESKNGDKTFSYPKKSETETPTDL